MLWQAKCEFHLVNCSHFISGFLKGIKTMLEIILYYITSCSNFCHFHKTEKFITIQFINNSIMHIFPAIIDKL